MDLDRIVFIGRTLEEYQRFFEFSVEELRGKRVLDCPSGCSSFTTQVRELGVDAVAADLLFELPADELIPKAKGDLEHALVNAYRNPVQFNWDEYGGMENHKQHRIDAYEWFRRDYEQRRAEGRYVPVKLPKLPFEDDSFDLVFSSHFLFLYAKHLDFDFHLQCLREFHRVAKQEVLIYPLTTLEARVYPRLPQILEELEKEGINTQLREISFEFQKNSNQILVISK